MVQEEILAETRSFLRSRVILTAVELDFFTRLDKKPSRANELAESAGLDRRVTTRILDCLISFELLEKADGLYHNTEKGAYLSAKHPETVLPMVLHMNNLWKTWSGLTDVVRNGTELAIDPGLKSQEIDFKAFIGAMHVAAKELSFEIADAYDMSPHKCLLDVGGASGTYTIAFLRKNPKLKSILFDLKDVIPMARERLEAEGLYDRVKFVAADFYKDELPKGADIALLSAIVHQNSIDENLILLHKIHRVLDSGGTILIRDHIMDESRTKPAAGALFALNMIVNTRGGDTYTFSEIKDVLEKAGFRDVMQVRRGENMDCLVQAKKPV